ncbi:hypothetical protein [Archangium violaceum]|uniref:hypothetical protein n=1 Tax=Archangium violaceum TaxID=83451 RepID=UPI0036D9E7B7
MAYRLATKSIGIEGFTNWHVDASDPIPRHCVYHDGVIADSIIRVTAYKRATNLQVAHSYAIKDVWGPGGISAGCASSQLVKTDAAGVYGYGPPPSALAASGGFSVYILGPTGTPLDPGQCSQADRPQFLYEVIQPLAD